jgi:error-prone DNA polymerase
LGLRLVKGLRQEDGEAIECAVAERGPFDSIEALRRASGVRLSVLRRLARADAFQSMGLDRQRALWAIKALRDDELPMFEQAAAPDHEIDKVVKLPEVSAVRKVVHDYASMHLSLKAHPMSFLRDELDAMRVTPAVELKDEGKWRQGSWINVAGLVLVRQRPATAQGIVFMTIEDETGIANLIVRPPIYQRFRPAARHGVAILARGRVERRGQVVHVLTSKLESLDDRMVALASRSRDFR